MVLGLGIFGGQVYRGFKVLGFGVLGLLDSAFRALGFRFKLQAESSKLIRPKGWLSRFVRM